ncbi:MAG: hypothetical protein ABII07_00720 [Patescibacteria group bacterium]|nr:hypothetical protein [Patescibacteria group bacterium]
MKTYEKSRANFVKILLVSAAALFAHQGCNTQSDDDSSGIVAPNCSDGEDNDNDGFIDLDDPECDCLSGSCTRGRITDWCESVEGLNVDPCQCPQEAHPHWECS